jgi:hypothetical protein
MKILRLKKLKPVYYYWSNCNEEANIKNAKWCSKCGIVVCHFLATKKTLRTKAQKRR